MRHTKDSLTLELEQAQRGGSPNEITDLRILLGSAPGDVAKARNRQAQRRHQRARASAPAAPTGAGHARKPRVGDWVAMTDSNGTVHGPWPITEVTSSAAVYDVPGKPMVRIELGAFTSGRARIVDAPSAPSEPTAAPEPTLLDACDGFYHAVRDASDERDWQKLDAACEAYELALAALGV